MERVWLNEGYFVPQQESRKVTGHRPRTRLPRSHKKGEDSFVDIVFQGQV
jgi:hypothetical protein